ncbi:MAG TPA: COX15/CtaA family protein [Stellaceae bacterium]|nr:COX15/CtaA family protein [Stellaceae bacterium]
MTVSTSVSATEKPERTDRSPRPVAIWLLACCAMIIAMVVIGGITRLTWSGLSITEWQPVTGIVPPLSAAAWQAEFAKYQQIPQYRLLNAGMSLGDFKTIFLWEYVHRLWGRLIGFVYLVPFLYFLIRGRISRRLAWPLAGIFALGGCQGALGWYMVESGLADRIEVSQYRLTAHLALALVIYAATLWTALGLLENPRGGAPPRIRRGAELVLALVGLTIVAGGFVAGLNAGLVYNTFPLMDGRFVPAGYAQLEPFIRNWFENVPAVQFDHRLLAMTTVGSVILLWFAGARGAPRSALPVAARRALHALLAAALLQLALGISTLLLVVPIALATVHQGGAVLLLTAAIVLRHRLRASG